MLKVEFSTQVVKTLKYSQYYRGRGKYESRQAQYKTVKGNKVERKEETMNKAVEE